jgi:hypothetical protein
LLGAARHADVACRTGHRRVPIRQSALASWLGRARRQRDLRSPASVNRAARPAAAPARRVQRAVANHQRGNDMNRAITSVDARIPALIGLGLLTASLLAGYSASAGPARGKATRVAAATSACLTFAELEHCPIASATLELAADRLTVRNPASSNAAGVAIELPDARTWSGAMRVVFAGGANDIWRAESLAGGVATSEVEARRSGNGFAFAAAFTGNMEMRTYSAIVYRDGVLQGSMGNIPSRTQGIWIRTDRETTSLFVVNPSGGCSWEFRYAGPAVPMKLASGLEVMGDEVRLVEEVKPSGGYPYTTFDGLTFRGDFTRIDFTAETFE